MKNNNAVSSANPPKGPFSRPFIVDQARDTKISVEIVAEAAERAELAAFLQLPAINSLHARYEVKPLTRGRYEVSGEVRANVVQTCVVTLEDFSVDVLETADAIYAPPVREPSAKAKAKGAVVEVSLFEGEDPPDEIVNGKIDLGSLTTEFLALGLDPWPRKTNAEFQPGADGKTENQKTLPFAALEKLKRGS
jgi:hypothetical protein